MIRTILFTSARNGDNPRGNAVMEVIERLKSLEACQSASDQTAGELLQAVNRLKARGHLVTAEREGGGFELVYIPSARAKEEVFAIAPGGAWDEKTIKKHRNAFRTSVGALFRFPLEGSEGVLEAFITDWSPFPAAAAVAVHKNHPLVRSISGRPENYFSGHFVRHPLTGDLLPVWVASWVKPEFGTGVVIVNPAHSAADLAFARSVGLPVRFCLVATEVSGDPATWPNPPIIKAGKTTKTGSFDGLDVAGAVERYFEVLSAHGFAEKCVDKGVGSLPVIAYKHDGSGETLLCERCGAFWQREGRATETCRDCGGECSPVSFEPGELLKSVLAVDSSAPFDIFCPTSEVDSTLLFARLLFFELRGEHLSPQRCHQLANVEKTKFDLPPDVTSLAMIAAAAPAQVAVIKQQILDQVRLFSDRHKQLLQTYDAGTAAVGEQSDGLHKTFSRAKECFTNWKLSEAFSLLYEAQKQLTKLPEEASIGQMPMYFSLAFALAGYEYPNNLNVTDIWPEI